MEWPSRVRSSVPVHSDDVLAAVAAVVAGVFVAVMIRLNATLGEHIGVLESSFVVHLVGTGFAAGLVLWRHNALLGPKARGAPAYTYFGGVLGVAIVMLANIVVPVLGVALTLSLSVAANLTFSTLSDHFGWFGLPQFRVSAQRLIGLALVLAGVLMVAFS
jgi:bacterial/archaeal transporter family-2 protein